MLKNMVKAGAPLSCNTMIHGPQKSRMTSFEPSAQKPFLSTWAEWHAKTQH